MQEMAVRSLDELLAGSAATDGFKRAARDLAVGKAQGAIVFSRGNPPVKALRLVMKLLEDFPDFAFDSIAIDGQSGCSDFRGTAVAQPGGAKFEFVWDCMWRAEQLGWVDAFGDPDQTRAARQLGYQCFERLERV